MFKQKFFGGSRNVGGQFFKKAPLVAEGSTMLVHPFAWPWKKSARPIKSNIYNALMEGELEQYDAYDETRADFSRWKGIYETWMRRKKAYRTQIQKRKLSERPCEFSQHIKND